MKSLLKDKPIQVLLNAEDNRDVARAVALESRRRGTQLGKATLIRELAMPRVREIIAAGDEAAP